ncbi:MAG: LLM class flavin-dependent oxidoreductase, partial [Actinomycetota bacterium]
DGFICTSGKGPELYRDKLIPAVDEGLVASGRGGGEIDRMIEIKLSYDPDPALALENTRFWAPLSLSPEQKHGLSDPTQMEAASDALSIEQVASRWIVASDPETALSQIKPYVDLGFNHLVFHGPGHDQSRFLTSFTAEVVPGLRTLLDERFDLSDGA